MNTTAIILAAGVGKRMGTSTAKQYLLLDGAPVLSYTLRSFEASIVDNIILVAGADDLDTCGEMVSTYGCKKVKAIVPGGKERYHSVYQGLLAAANLDPRPEVVLIHDGARPFVDDDMIKRGLAKVSHHSACVMGMPVKDTIKLADANGFVDTTPDRELIWQIQTPQIFTYDLVKKCYDALLANEEALLAEGVKITDDAMVVERFSDTPIKLVKGAYENIKITTPEDMEIALCFLKKGIDTKI